MVAGTKTDRLDCLKLAQFAAKGLLQPIAVPTPREEAERGLLRRRHQLVDAVRRVKQRIKGLLLLHGAAEPPGLVNWSRSAVAALESLDLEPAVRDTLGSHLRELDFQTGELRRVEAKLAELLRDERHAETTRCLRTAPGIGLIVAETFRLELFRPERFAHAGQVASYVGLAPTVRQSGERQGRGRIMPVGQRRLRSLLVEAAWIWVQRDAGAKALYGRLLGRMGITQKKAIAAMARRLVVILWRLSVEQRPYRPLAAQP